MGASEIPTIILCGGRGTRISEVDPTIPKPLIPVGGRPVLWHIMKVYAEHGATDFVGARWLEGRDERLVAGERVTLIDPHDAAVTVPQQQ